MHCVASACSEASKAQLQRRAAKESTVVMGLHAALTHAALTHAAAAARWSVDNGAFQQRLDEAALPARHAAVLACELLALHLARDTDNQEHRVDQNLCAAALRIGGRQGEDGGGPQGHMSSSASSSASSRLRRKYINDVIYDVIEPRGH